MRRINGMVFASLAKLRFAPALLGLFILPAQAQDSFVREIDPASGQPVLSALGSGLGLTYAAMALEVECPADGIWTMDLTGIRAAPGMPILVGFDDATGRFIPVPALPQGFIEDRLRFTVGRGAFARALAQAQAEYAGQGGSARTVQVGDVVGLSVGRDELAREMAALVSDCEPRRRTADARR